MPFTITFAEQSTGIVLDPEGRWKMEGAPAKRAGSMLEVLEEIAGYLRKYPGAEAWIGHGDASFRIVLPPPPSFVRWLANFKATGDTGGVRRGMNPGELVSLLGMPRETLLLTRKYPCSVVLRYERALDFHFDRHGVLFMAHDDSRDMLV